jgi:hypothetical protein
MAMAPFAQQKYGTLSNRTRQASGNSGLKLIARPDQSVGYYTEFRYNSGFTSVSKGSAAELKAGIVNDRPLPLST